MIHIGWLILVGMGMAMAGLFLGGACRSSGDASRCEECALEYRRRVAEFERRILELETLLADDATDVFAKPPDEDDGCDPEADRMRAWFAEYGHD